MTPEARAHVDRAREDLDEARKIADIGLPGAAARSAYFAAFHAAEALIIERAGKVAKTHSGVRAEFARLLKSASGAERPLLKFLAQAYKYKEISDYGVGMSAVVVDRDDREAIKSASLFVDRVVELMVAR